MAAQIYQILTMVCQLFWSGLRIRMPAFLQWLFRQTLYPGASDSFKKLLCLPNDLEREQDAPYRHPRPECWSAQPGYALHPANYTWLVRYSWLRHLNNWIWCQAKDRGSGYFIRPVHIKWRARRPALKQVWWLGYCMVQMGGWDGAVEQQSL